MLKAVIFDFDGLIVDTETPWYRAYREYYRRHGAELALADWGKCVGTGFAEFDPHRHLEACIGRTVDPQEMKSATKALFEREMEGADVRPGVRDYLAEAKCLGLKVGLASSSSRAWVESYLRRFGLFDGFDCIRTADDVRNIKPNPELYLRALEGLGVRAEEAVAFEDSVNGSAAALRAGVACVIVQNPVTEGLEFASGLPRLNSMADMPLGDLLRSSGVLRPSRVSPRTS